MGSRIERAKQFLPFDALTGLQEALRQIEKEMEYDEKIELSEESLEELQDKFNRIKQGNNIWIKYYKNKKYVEIRGIITNIDYTKKKIQINKIEEINICDILDIAV